MACAWSTLMAAQSCAGFFVGAALGLRTGRRWNYNAPTLTWSMHNFGAMSGRLRVGANLLHADSCSDWFETRIDNDNVRCNCTSPFSSAA
ncbi:hypothetical protein B0H12DRAFT_1100674 [Mycena haematopus]|nr:hypothetical protein B0H12DRAFT_1100674 [Mycena haematopus]